MTWKLQNIRGTRDKVKSDLAASDVPASVKDFIFAQIDDLPADSIACRLDSYCQDVESPKDMKMMRRIEVTLVGIKV